MSFFLTAIVFILVFSALVLIHEWGHYIVAKKSGIKIEEFGFGLPPRIWGVKKGETIFSINAIPFGGFVRLLGEDGSDEKVKKNPRSFINKPARIRILVVIAGVIMNFLLAWLLLTIGFTFGIQPLILSGDDVLASIQDGTIQTQQGVTVKEVKQGGAAEKAGMLPGDKLLQLNGKEIFSSEELLAAVNSTKNATVVAEVERNGQHQFLNLKAGEKDGLGFSSYELVFLPRMVVREVAPDVKFASGDLQPGDILLTLNNTPIYTYDEYVAELGRSRQAEMTLWRGDKTVSAVVDLPVKQRVIISDIFPDSPAEKAAFQSGDVLLRVDGQDIAVPQDVIGITKQNPGKTLTYILERNGEQKTLQVQPDKNGLIGVGLSVLYPHENQFVTLYAKDEPTTVLKIQDVRYPFWIAPLKAFDESFRLGGLTVQMFGNVLKSFFTKFTIPEGVAGPVGIAQLTYTFVQQGVLSLLRFMALLSLSLAIINILPFPALDGGRLFFILIELVIGRKVNGKWEGVIHTIGFALLMILIVAVTYSDIIKLF